LTTYIILRQIRSFCNPQSKTKFETQSWKSCGTVRVTWSKNCLSTSRLYVVHTTPEFFTALTIMVIVCRMRRRVVWQTHKILKNCYPTDEAACSTETLVAATKLHDGLH